MNANIDLQQFIEQLRRLDPNNPGSWPLWAQVGAILLLCGIVIGLGYRFVIKPQQEELARAQQQEITLKQEFEKKQKKVAALDAFRTQLEEMQQTFGELLRQLPNKSEVANLLNEISQTRLAAGLEEQLFQPQSEINRDFYAVLPIKMELLGDYHQMGAFVSGIATLHRIVTLDSVVLQPEKKGGPRNTATNTKSQLKMNVTAKTYRYLEADEQAAAAGTQ